VSAHTIVLELSVIEAAHLTDLVEQFTGLLDETLAEDGLADPAVARLVPDVYPDDAEAAAEFRRLTEADLLDRRRADAALVVSTLLHDGDRLTPGAISSADAETTFPVVLDERRMGAWLRTLSALRLVLASRLGIQTEDDHVDEDPRFGIYDWLGYRLDALVRAVEA